MTLLFAHAPAVTRLPPARRRRPAAISWFRPCPIKASRIAWGEIRARYRAKHLVVPA